MFRVIQAANGSFDTNAIITGLNQRGAKVVISRHPRRIGAFRIDRDRCKWCHLIDTCFCKLKQFKRIAMRAYKTDKSFSAMIYITAAVVDAR